MTKCTECENETILKYSDLAVELERYKEYYTKLNKCLDTKDELCKILREDNERYRNLYELWKEKAIKLQEEKE